MTTDNAKQEPGTMSDERKALVSVNADDLRFVLTHTEIISQEAAAAADRLLETLSAEPSPDAAQGEVPKSCPRCKGSDFEVLVMCHNSACPDYAKEISVFKAWHQNRAPHPSQAGAEAVDEGMVSVPRGDLLALINAPLGIKYNRITDRHECLSCGAIDKASRCNHAESCAYEAHIKVVARVVSLLEGTKA